MFSIIHTEIEYLDFEKEREIDEKYVDLLEEEYRAVARDQDEIEEKGRRLYEDVVMKKKSFFVKLSWEKLGIL